jgi:hypothetical protein
MSVYHRIGGLDEVPAAVFLPRMVRLPLYGGAVAYAVRTAADEPAEDDSAAVPDPEPMSPGVMNSALYGPLPAAGQAAVFDFS